MLKLTWILPFAGAAALLLIGLVWFTDMLGWIRLKLSTHHELSSG
jgi:hypothetical protein